MGTRPFNKVFGIGLSKTGTTSLAAALEMLGVRCVHFPKDERTFEQLTRGDWRLDILESHDAVTDTPVVPYYRQFDRLYPGSKFILTVRDESSWLNSVETQFSSTDRWTELQPRLRPYYRFIRAAVYGTWHFERQRFGDVLNEHHRRVQDYFSHRPEALLVMDISQGDGWEKLCPFLGIDPPDLPFPRSNTRDSRAADRQWVENLEHLRKALDRRVPKDQTIAFIDEESLVGTVLRDERRAISFPAVDGHYGGIPRDDRHAIDELHEAVSHGVRYLLIVQPCFWWLDHYPRFAAELEDIARCVEVTEFFKLFELNR